jgi:FKBP-type peptidyl-prolyl cis-trans isomerase SlyD
MSENLTIEKNRVVRFDYTITDAAGAVLETTAGDEPLSVLHGHGSVLRALEAALADHVAGDVVSVTLEPADAYGERREDWTQRVSKKYLPKGRLEPGMTIRLSTDRGPRTVTVIKVGNKMVDVDLNHPYAGRTLCFELTVREVREASAEEIAHGHVHGPGGHHH